MFSRFKKAQRTEKPQPTMPPSTMNSLSKLISDSVAIIEQNCAARNVSFPSLDVPFSIESEAARLDPQVSEAASHIIAAAAQLVAIVRPAPMTLVVKATQFHVPSALRLATDSNTVEILREAGPQGLHVKDIAERNHINPDKLGRALRLLATEHILTEVSPNVFANNRISSALDTGKAVATLFEKPEDKYNETSGVAALVSHFSDDAFKASAYLTDALINPEKAKSDENSEIAFNLAYKTDLPIFSWFERPGNEARLRRFQTGFEAGSRMFPAHAILQGYNWGALPKGSVIVDVGGGLGSQTLPVASTHLDLKCIVQDRGPVIAEGIRFFESHLPEAVKSGQVQFQEIDFMESQPVKNARVYFLRMILHDWTDDVCIHILKKIREAAGSESELMVIDSIVDYACTDTTISKELPGGLVAAPPSPLLPNGGYGQIFPYLVDVQMMALTHGKERTLAEFVIILEKSGWRAKEVHRPPGSAPGHPKIVAVPV